MMRRTLARTIISSSPAQGTLRPFLLAVLTTITVPNVSFACGMYIPGPAAELVAEVGEEAPAKEAPKLAAAFAAIDEAGLDELLGATEAPAAEEAEEAREATVDAQAPAAADEEISADAAPQS